MGLIEFSFVVLLLLSNLCEGTHFRGGTASWKHHRSDGNTHDIELIFRFGWRRSYATFRPPCDDNVIESQSISGPGGWGIYFNQEDNGQATDFPISTAIKCTAYDIDEDWMYGFNNVRTNITAELPFHIGFQSNSWISTLKFGANGAWSIALLGIDVGVRSDTGLVNHPPRTLSPPVVRLKLGCPSSITVSMSHEDGDILGCRYGITYNECGDICGNYSHFTLDTELCTISYDGGGLNSTIPVALMIYDRPERDVYVRGRLITTDDIFSKIPLQFLVQIEEVANCLETTYPSYSIPDNAVFEISKEGTLSKILYAVSPSPAEINRFIIIGPLGVQKSQIYRFSGYVYATNITWDPSEDQTGTNVICYYAVDDLNNNGRQRCFQVIVSEKIIGPCEFDNGGCSDICSAVGTVGKCSCSKPCWGLGIDLVTCVPDMSVMCFGESINVTVAACATNKTIVVGSSLSAIQQKECQSVYNLNQELNLRPSDCNITIQSNPVRIEYVMDLWIWDEDIYSQSQPTIVRGRYLKIPALCSFPTSVNVTGSFIPVQPFKNEFISENILIKGLGSFDFSFDFYRKSDFQSAYGPLDYPLEIAVNDDIFFSVEADGRGGLKLFVDKCIAQSTRTLTSDTLQYTFIENGCLIDPTAVQYESAYPMQSRFSIKAFEFANSVVSAGEDTDIYFQCQVILCDATEEDTRCSENCLPVSSVKRKRSVRTDENIREEDVDDDDESPVKPSLSESPLQDITARLRLRISSDDKVDDTINRGSICYSSLILLEFGVILSSTNLWFGK